MVQALTTGGAKVYEINKAGDLQVKQLTAAEAEKAGLAAQTETGADKKVFAGLTQNQLLIGGGIVAVLLMVMIARKGA